EHLLHQNQSLTGSEIRDAPAGCGEPLAERCRRMFALRFDKEQKIAPEVLPTVHHRVVVAATHRGRTGDWKCAGTLRYVNFDVDDRFRAVASSRNTGIPKRRTVFTVRFSIRRQIAEILAAADDHDRDLQSREAAQNRMA